jgi:uncharacterized membrane protein
MTKTRLEAFSDGVLAIIITIMVLELKVPHETSLAALAKLAPVFTCYVLSFLYVGIYWVNHHHTMHTVHHVTGAIMWSNMGLLFALSLIPFTTSWMGENHYHEVTVAVYGANLLLCAIAFYVFQLTIQRHYRHETSLTLALKQQEKKGIVSSLLYIVAIPFSFVYPVAAAVIHAAVAVWWLLPNRNIERALHE